MQIDKDKLEFANTQMPDLKDLSYAGLELDCNASFAVPECDFIRQKVVISADTVAELKEIDKTLKEYSNILVLIHGYLVKQSTLLPSCSNEIVVAAQQLIFCLQLDKDKL